MWWRVSWNRWTGGSAINVARVAVTVLVTTGQIAWNCGPIVKHLALERACAIVHTPHSLRTTFGGDGPERGWFWLPAQAMWVDYVQGKVRWTLYFGTVNAILGAHTKRLTFVIELVVQLVFSVPKLTRTFVAIVHNLFVGCWGRHNTHILFVVI
jgi:hypothetical protein